MTDRRNADAASVPFRREFKFSGCFVTVSVVDHGAGPRVNVNAGATMEPQEALQLAEAIVEARAAIEASA
jgi:hypothetical protein